MGARLDVSLLLFLLIAAVVAGDRGDVSPRRGWRDDGRLFSWRASLDRTTGVASSLERSTFLAPTHREEPPPSDKQMKVFANEIFAEYPRFLGRPSLTLGLLRAVVGENSICHLRTSLVLPLEVLTFGAPRAAPSKLLNRDAKDIATHRKVVCCVAIPIAGGLLANVDPKCKDNGCLRFTWLRSKGGRSSSEMMLVTEIAGNYRPALAGKRSPVPLWRSFFYCSTQRVLHAYVMWRYHAFAMREYRCDITNMD